MTESEIWNQAIEAAAAVIDACNREGPFQAIGGAARIRRLARDVVAPELDVPAQWGPRKRR